MGDNVLTPIIPDIYTAMQIVAREPVGLTMGSMMNTGEEVPALNTSVKSIFVPAATVEDITPDSTAPNPSSMTPEVREMKITKRRKASFKWGTEEIRRVDQGSRSRVSGAVYQSLAGAQVEEAVRAIVNEIEGELFTELQQSIGIATGTAGTRLFNVKEDISDAVDAYTTLDNQGCPEAGRQMVLGSNAVTNILAKQPQYLGGFSQVSDENTIRTGILPNLIGFDVRKSAAIRAYAKQGANKAINNSGGFPAGTKTLTIDGGGARIRAGDLVTIGSVTYGVEASASSTSITLAEGLKAAVSDNDTVTVVGNHTKNMVFHRGVVEVAIRPTEPGGLSTDNVVITDPMTGLVMSFTHYGGYHQDQMEVSCLYGTQVWQPEFVVAMIE